MYVVVFIFSTSKNVDSTLVDNYVQNAEFLANFDAPCHYSLVVTIYTDPL